MGNARERHGGGRLWGCCQTTRRGRRPPGSSWAAAGRGDPCHARPWAGWFMDEMTNGDTLFLAAGFVPSSVAPYLTQKGAAVFSHVLFRLSERLPNQRPGCGANSPKGWWVVCVYSGSLGSEQRCQRRGQGVGVGVDVGFVNRSSGTMGCSVKRGKWPLP
ncbi:hypothetical protein F4778DRAFT_740362 [Xylariomycetidae sp. FL2044]|nr:hypothetical protein F4778DRAFT_740362 [Xylariomycetidae sp. FL2044]